MRRIPRESRELSRISPLTEASTPGDHWSWSPGPSSETGALRAAPCRYRAEKRPSAIDRKAVSLTLTTEGGQQRKELLALRQAALAPLVRQVAPEDLAVFERVVETITAGLPEDAFSALTTCRFCDGHRCVDCPMEVFGTLDTAGTSVVNT